MGAKAGCRESATQTRGSAPQIVAFEMNTSLTGYLRCLAGQIPGLVYRIMLCRTLRFCPSMSTASLLVARQRVDAGGGWWLGISRVASLSSGILQWVGPATLFSPGGLGPCCQPPGTRHLRGRGPLIKVRWNAIRNLLCDLFFFIHLLSESTRLVPRKNGIANSTFPP